MTLRCPICFAPLVSVDGTPTNVNDTLPTGGDWVCSRYPFGYTMHARLAIAEAGCCPINGYLQGEYEYRQTPVCMHAQEGSGGWAVCLGAPYLVPVKDSLVDLVTDTLADT